MAFRRSAGWAAMAAALVVLLLSSARAEDGRDFAGFYQVTNAAEGPLTTELTLMLRVSNFSGADITGARVFLRSALDPLATLGAFAPADLAQGRGERLQGAFVVPTDEFRSWQDGTAPRVAVEYDTAQGETVVRQVELLPGLVAEEAN